MVRVIAHYMFTVSQGQIDMDSAVLIPCKIYGLSPFLIYNESYSDGASTLATTLIDHGKIDDAKLLLTRLNGELKMRLLIELGSYFVFKPGSKKADLNAASYYIKEAIALSAGGPAKWKIASLIIHANVLNQYGRVAESLKVCSEIKRLSQKNGNPETMALALVTEGKLLAYGAPGRLIDYEKALAIYQKLHDKEKEIETLSDINIEYFVLKKYNLAEQVMFRIRNLQKELDFRQQQYVDDALAYIANRKGDIAGAILFSDKSLEELVTKQDSVFASYFYSRRSFLSEHLMKYQEALKWIDKALTNISSSNRLYWYKSFLAKADLLIVTKNPGEALALINRISRRYPPITAFERMNFSYLLGETYQSLRRYDLADKNYKAFLAIADTFPGAFVHDEMPSAFFQVAEFYRRIGQTKKARELLNRGRAYTPTIEIERKGTYYYNLFKIDSTEKKYLEAVGDLSLCQKYMDSAFSYEQVKHVQELLVKYEDDKKNKDIKLLNSENQLQRIRVAEATMKEHITDAGIVLLLLIIGLLYNSYRIKQRNNLLLEANQKELDQKNMFLERANTDKDRLLKDKSKLLKEKNWLLEEVHHRVKNNLQLVTGLLYTQSFYIKDQAALVAVKDSLRRMQAISMIHQKLYQDENSSKIPLQEYINDLILYLSDSFEAEKGIIFLKDIEPVDLGATQAIPLGLIITECVVNVIKHAFPDGRNGTVSITLFKEGAELLVLKICDDGIGLPTDFDPAQSNSLGLELILGLSRQLNGSFIIENENGLNITISFLIAND